MATVAAETRGAVGLAQLDRPDARNALSPELMEELAAICERWDDDPEVRCIVIAGGDKWFAAGADIKAMAKRTLPEVITSPAARFWPRLAALRTPLIAAVSGYALGGGCELAMCTDIRIAADDAVLGQPEVLLGIIPGAGGTQRLTRLVGPARAKDIIFTGRFVKADEAERIGLVVKVVPSAQVYDEALAWAGQFRNAASYALRAAKAAIDRGLEVDLDTGLEIERALFASLFGTEDRTAGMRSFVENGPGKAEFKGA
jgi:enoyl-CoA hydratase/carnithine racemase